jgi:glycosyltransferase involved in cell wall biosynthesis
VSDLIADPPEVSVVIPALDAADGLRVTLDALAAAESPPRFEVIVVDNGSRDDTVAVASGHDLGVRVLREPTPGPYAARNTGMAAAHGRIIALTDADCTPVPRWLSAGVAEIAGGADLVGGRIVQRSTGPRASMWESYDRATYLNQQAFVTEQRFAATANLFVRAAVVADVGAFRPELTASGDLEFGHRATDRGYCLVYSDAAAVLHEPRTTLRDTWRLHRKLGCGFAELARAGLRESAHRDIGVRIGYRYVGAQLRAAGIELPRHRIVLTHTTAMAARWVGRVTARA